MVHLVIQLPPLITRKSERRIVTGRVTDRRLRVALPRAQSRARLLSRAPLVALATPTGAYTSEPEQNPDLGSACGRLCQENDRRSGPEIDQNG